MDIKKRNRNELKSFFRKNSIPTQEQFADLIDGCLNQQEDRVVKPSATEPLCIEAAGDAASVKKAISFYENFQDPNPAWTLQLRAGDGPAQKQGFSINDGAGKNRLFIDAATGKVVIGEDGSASSLHVKGKLFLASNGLPNSEAAGLLLQCKVSDDTDRSGNPVGTSTASLLLETKTNTEIGACDDQGFWQSLMHFERATGRIGIGRDANGATEPTVVLNGKGFVHDGIANNTIISDQMGRGSLTIGSVSSSYGDDPQNRAGLLLQTRANTEIAVYDEQKRFRSLLHYEGDTTNRITIGRNLGNGAVGSVIVNGKALVSDGSNAEVLNKMAAGSLTIGNIAGSYGGGTTTDATNLAGLLLQTKANTEIAVHDSGNSMVSLMYYEGDGVNRITIGRDMGWGALSSIVMKGKVTMEGSLTVNAQTNVKGISSPQFRVTQVIDKRANLPQSGNFTSGGGTLVIWATGSGWRTAAGWMGMGIKIDGKAINVYSGIFVNDGTRICHLAFSPIFQVVTGVAAGTHSLELFTSDAITDINDYFRCIVLELPF